MLSGTYFVAMTAFEDGSEIWEDVYFKSEERAKAAADKLVETYGGKAVVEEIEW